MVVLVVVQEHIIIWLPEQAILQALLQYKEMLVELVDLVLVLSHLVVAVVVPVVLVSKGRHHQDHKEQKVV
jgi:hypothetical protein